MQAAFYDQEHVYTFHIAQHVVDIAAYKLMLPGWGHTLFGHLDGQPIRFMAYRPSTQEYFWNLEVRL